MCVSCAGPGSLTEQRPESANEPLVAGPQLCSFPDWKSRALFNKSNLTLVKYDRHQLRMETDLSPARERVHVGALGLLVHEVVATVQLEQRDLSAVLAKC